MAAGPGALLTGRLLGGGSDYAQLWFETAVLERYRAAGAKLLRTNTIGRLKQTQWSLYFGIAQSGAQEFIHVSIADAHLRIPEEERSHWASHAITLPLSAGYVTTQLTRGACIDDGELRAW